MIKQSDTTREKPVRIARRAIDALEKKIFEEFDLRVTLGAEQEFTVQTHSVCDANGMLISNPLKLPGVEAKGDYAPQAQKEGEQSKDCLFPDSPYVAYSHKERPIQYGKDEDEIDAPLLPYFQYETVLSHEAFKRDESDGALHMRGNHLARALEGLRNILMSNPSDLLKKGPFTHVEDVHEHVKRVHLSPVVANDTITNGLHITVGLEEPASRPSLFADHPVVLSPIQAAIEDMNLEAAHLMPADACADTRHELREEYTTVEAPEGANYVANQVAPANANPYYAILTTLAGVYAGLKRMHESKPNLYMSHAAEQRGREHSRCHGAFVSSRFTDRTHLQSDDNGLRTLLNDVEAGLGDTLVAAVGKTPPGEELLPVQGRVGGRAK